MSDELVASLQRELQGTQQMLGQVLLEIGKPVVISKESLKVGVPEGAAIDIQDTGDAFVFSIRVDDGQQ